MTFLEQTETAIRSKIKSKFSVMGFSPICGLWFLCEYQEGKRGTLSDFRCVWEVSAVLLEGQNEDGPGCLSVRGGIRPQVLQPRPYFPEEAQSQVLWNSMGAAHLDARGPLSLNGL